MTLQARYTPPAPPLPPTPPPRPDVIDSNFLEQTLKDLTHSLDSLKGELSSMQLPSWDTLELPKLETLAPSLKDQLDVIQGQLATLDAGILARLDGIAHKLEAGLLADYPSIQPLYEKIVSAAAPMVVSHPSAVLVATASISYLLVSQILSIGKAPPPTRPYPLGRYDPVTARAYFDQRPLQVAARSLQILVSSLQFGLSLLRDQLKYVNVKLPSLELVISLSSLQFYSSCCRFIFLDAIR